MQEVPLVQLCPSVCKLAMNPCLYGERAAPSSDELGLIRAVTTLKMTSCGWTLSKGAALAAALHMVTPNEYTSHLGPNAPALRRNSGAWYPDVPTSFCKTLHGGGLFSTLGLS